MAALVQPPSQGRGIGSEYPVPAAVGLGGGSLAHALELPGVWSGQIVDTPAQIVQLQEWFREALAVGGVPGATRKANVGSFFIVQDPMDANRYKKRPQTRRDVKKLRKCAYACKVTEWRLTCSSGAIAMHILVFLDPRPPVGTNPLDHPENPAFDVEGKPCHLWISGNQDLISITHDRALEVNDAEDAAFNGLGADGAPPPAPSA